MKALIHGFMHSLAFDLNLFKDFVDENGNQNDIDKFFSNLEYLDISRKYIMKKIRLKT